jgi:hypothetical protein
MFETHNKAKELFDALRQKYPGWHIHNHCHEIGSLEIDISSFSMKSREIMKNDPLCAESITAWQMVRKLDEQLIAHRCGNFFLFGSRTGLRGGRD